jgi:hypothetical protein
MRVARVFLAVALACATGCTTGRLRQRTINQGSTLPELQYQQVLNNLALFAANPASLPWHVNLREGTTQITDSITAGSLVDLGPPAVTQPQVFGSRTAVAQWGMSPVIDATELRLLRIAYRRAHGLAEMPDPEFLDELAHELKDQLATNSDLRDETELFFERQSRVSQSSRDLDRRMTTTNDASFCDGSGESDAERSPLARNVCRKIDAIQRDLARIGPGWFHVGQKRDVPKGACYVGRCGDRYVWVEPDGVESLTEFTLTVLKLSSLIKETQTLINPGSVKFSPGDRGG